MALIPRKRWLAQLALVPLTFSVITCGDRFPRFPILSAGIQGLTACYSLLFMVCVLSVRSGARLPSSYEYHLAVRGLFWVTFCSWPIWWIIVLVDAYRLCAGGSPDIIVSLMGWLMTYALAAFIKELAILCGTDLLPTSHHAEPVNLSTLIEALDHTETSSNCIFCVTNRPDCNWSDCQHVLYCMDCYEKTVKDGGNGQCPYCQKGAEVKKLLFP